MPDERRSFKLNLATGEASLVQVARRAKVEGVWLHQDGKFRDISAQQDLTRATFTVRIERKTPFTIYHIHPARVGTPGGFIDTRRGFKISPPSLEDFDSYAKIHKTFGELATCRVADGWGIWRFGLTPEALKSGLVRTLSDRTLHAWIREAYAEIYRFRLDVSPGALRKFSERFLARGIVLRYETLNDLYARIVQRTGRTRL
jgi:hypothetical protein